jgi:hypothetical protein
MMRPKVDRELECVKVLAGLDDVEDRLYVYTPSYRTPEGLPPDYEMEAVLEICPETSGEFDIPVLPYAVYPSRPVTTWITRALVETQRRFERNCIGWSV